MLGIAAIAALVAAFLLARPQGTTEAEALVWLESRDLRGQIAGKIEPVLRKIWSEAFWAGVDFAKELTGYEGQISQQQLDDLLSQLSAEWVGQIVQTRMARLAAILASGGDAKELEAEIRAMFSDQAQADLIVHTETVRAFAYGAAAVYHAAGVHLVHWLTTSANPCPICLENEAAGTRPLGTPFPSGLLQPPQHPRCQCVLVPVTE